MSPTSPQFDPAPLGKGENKVSLNELIVISGIFLLLCFAQGLNIKGIWTFASIGRDLWLCWLGVSVRRALKPSRPLDIVLTVVSVAELLLVMCKLNESLFQYWEYLPWKLYAFFVGLVIPVKVNSGKDSKTFWGELLVAVFFVFIHAFGEFVGWRMWVFSFDKGGSEIAQAVLPVTNLFKVVVLPFAMYFILRPITSRNVLKLAELKWLKYVVIGLSVLYFVKTFWFDARWNFVSDRTIPRIIKNPFVLIVAYYLYNCFKKIRSKN